MLHSNLLSAFLVMKHFAPLMPDRWRIVRLRRLTSRYGRQGRRGVVLGRQGRPDHARQGRGDRVGATQHPRQCRRAGPDRHSDHRGVIRRRADPEAYRREREAQIPLQRLATPKEVADAISSSHRRSRPTSPEPSSPWTADTPPSDRSSRPIDIPERSHHDSDPARPNQLADPAAVVAEVPQDLFLAGRWNGHRWALDAVGDPATGAELTEVADADENDAASRWRRLGWLSVRGVDPRGYGRRSSTAPTS